jgi:hypothetical protein
MAKGRESEEIRRLAQLGAEARLIQLDQERANLLRMFPRLRQATRPPESSDTGAAESQPKRRRRRSRMSAEGRKAVSARMKAYWANRRSANSKPKNAR